MVGYSCSWCFERVLSAGGLVEWGDQPHSDPRGGEGFDPVNGPVTNLVTEVAQRASRARRSSASRPLPGEILLGGKM